MNWVNLQNYLSNGDMDGTNGSPSGPISANGTPEQGFIHCSCPRGFGPCGYIGDRLRNRQPAGNQVCDFAFVLAVTQHEAPRWNTCERG
jgi:hypothetical protein